MHNLENAKYLIKKEISKFKISDNDEIVIIEIIDKPRYWVFKYDSKKFLEIGDPTFMLLGNSPIIVQKNNLKMIQTGTAYHLEYYLSLYERGELK